MLEELTIKNYALIESVSISFEGGFNVLTGETGAGKSIIVGALSFLLGAKSDVDVIRTGCDEAGVQAVVSVNGSHTEALEWLKVRDIEIEDGQIIIRRTIKTSGRGSIFIQSIPVTRSDLQEFMSMLFDLHGQHSHETLMRKETHRKYLDKFTGLEEEALAFNRIFLELSEKRKILEASVNSERDRDTRLEILSYAVEEIDKAGVKSGESRELEVEAQRLGDFEKLASQVNNAAQALFEGDSSVLSLARKARTSMENAVSIDASLSSLFSRMEDMYYEAEDISEEFRSYRDGLRYDPERLEEVEERLALLFRLKKKYSGSTSGDAEEAVLAYRARAEAEMETLRGAEENREKLKSEIAVLEKDLVSRALSLSSKRQEGSRRLSTGITGILRYLGMPDAQFSASVLQKGKQETEVQGSCGGGLKTGNFVCGPWGADDIEFLISANLGEPMKELARIASGGELSRVMLAIKTVLCGTDAAGRDASAETLVFDEIDTGIGGEVALSVGEYLYRIGQVKQIFCVTHLASIAVRADNHFKVAKYSEGERTMTSVSNLGKNERRQEIARMLSGDAGSAALAHAGELLAKYGRS
ncbi:MAG: DNA repair protein RecN [Treponema sp.]|jgi:DNA repair protein RecN (Recombination protein N)|nr:DNA repair protein RecN [Treponema sp.]